MSGAVSYYSGLAAEDQVATHYQGFGCETRHKRWRGKGGEIDLVLSENDGLIFVEVKQSGDFIRAAESLSQRQMKRIYAAASEYLGQMPMGQDTEARFDVALVNQQGDINIIENAFGH